MRAQKVTPGGNPKAGAVAIIAPLPPPYGGMALQARALAERLSSEGIPVFVIETNPQLPELLAVIKGIRTLLQSFIYLFRLLSTLPRVKVIHILAASYFYFFARVVPAILLGRLFGRRVVLNYRGGEAPRFFAAYRRVLKPILGLANVITVPSSFLKRTFEKHNFTALTVPNLIDLERFKYRHRRRLTPRLLVSRNLEPMYNVKMALLAYEIIRRHHPDARLDVLGSGSEEKALLAWAKERRLEGIFFHGAVSHERVPEFLDRADILLNPTNVDNLPLSLLEAFACGVAVVSTNVGGIPDLLGNSGAALLVPPNDDRQMAVKVMELLANDTLAERTVAAARRLAEKYDWKTVRTCLLQAYYRDAVFLTATRTAESEPS